MKGNEKKQKNPKFFRQLMLTKFYIRQHIVAEII